MKATDSVKNIDILVEFALTNDEMICVKGGGDGDPIVVPTPPTVRI